MSVGDRLKHAFNSFFITEQPVYNPLEVINYSSGGSSAVRPDRTPVRFHSERTIISSIYTRLAIDVAAARIEHVKLDPDTEQFVETIHSGLNDCLKTQANLDQAGRHFRQDMAMSLFQEGCIGIVPVDTNLNPLATGGWDVRSLRVGVITEWWPEKVKIRAYNEKTGRHQEIVLPKSMVAIAENPFYSVMNEPNSTLKRLVHKLSLLDNVDEISSSGKLDIIIQLPFPVRGEVRTNQAKKRIDDLKEQLKDSTYGIAYADATEKITQLNRSVENNLLEQVKYLKTELYNELGLTEEIMNGTADDVAMLNYRNRTLEPVLDAITESMIRTFLTKTARTQGQSMMYFENPFKFLPLSELAKIADVLSRNQIVTPNEIRPALGLKPSKAPQANELVNSNMPLDKQITEEQVPIEEEEDIVDGEIVDEAEADLDEKMKALGL